MNGIYLGIGGNQGKREQYLADCIVEIEAKIGQIKKASHIYETAAWGNTKQKAFLNQVLFVRSKLSAQECMRQCLAIEKTLGRVRNRKWESRIIDIDILFYNNEIIKTKHLIVPHPHLHERNFVLKPMLEIAAYKIHPVLRKRIKTLYATCTDKLNAEIYCD